MKNRLLKKLVLVITLIHSLASVTTAIQTKPVQVELLSSPWIFNMSQVAQNKLSTQTPYATLTAPADISKGFTVRFTVDIKEFTTEQCILEIPWILRVNLRQHNVQDRARQNYPAFKMANGSVPVLEARITLQSPTDKEIRQDMTIGIPLAILQNPMGKHEVVLNFSGIRWTMYVDGELLDNDFALGYPQAEKINAWQLNPSYVESAEVCFPAITPQQVKLTTPRISTNIQYWTPEGHNTWVGDVVTFFHANRYHVFYLYDRRGHGSKFGRGAHYFEHLSTTDFKTWTEHTAATPLEEQWETFGTGTPFLFDGKFCISYGLHTTRIYPKEATTLPTIWEDLNKNGYTGSFLIKDMKAIPAGSSYSISQDGISNFKKTGILFHPCENPSIYTDPQGKLKMLANYGAKGTWESDSVNGGWRCTNENFPLGGDCTFFFRWGKFDYIIGGFTRLWSKPANAAENAYQDVVSQGFDFYNGLSVPAVTEIPGGRFLLAGWVQTRAWGGPLAIHELIQYPDGRIGTKWMPEITPETEKPTSISKKVTESSTVLVPTASESYLLTFDVHPTKGKSGKAAIVFLPENGDDNACELQINPEQMRAQFSTGSLNGYAQSEPTLRQGGNPQQARNYAVENLIDTDKPFTVRLLVKGSNKLGGYLLDAEIAGQRTLISYRPDLTIKKMLFRVEGVELNNVKIAPCK